MIEPGHYALFINRLYLSGFSVYALHLDGHGRNRHKMAPSLSAMVDQGLLAQEWILKQRAASLVLGGHSQGAICALMHGGLSNAPSALFAISGCLPQLPSAIHITRFGALAKWRKEILTILKYASGILPGLPIPMPLYLSGHKILANHHPPILTGKGASRISYPLRFLYSLFSSHIPERILCPLWLIGSRGDGLFTENINMETFKALSAPSKKLLYLPEGGHLAILNPWLARYCASICACAALSLKLPLNTAS